MITEIGSQAAERAPVATDKPCAPCVSGGCLERRDVATGECMAAKLGREYLAERAAVTAARREARIGGQLDLFDLALVTSGSSSSSGRPS